MVRLAVSVVRDPLHHLRTVVNETHRGKLHVGEVVDSKGPEVISSIAELVKAMPAGVFTAQDAGNAVPVLYRIEFAAGGVSLKKAAFN